MTRVRATVAWGIEIEDDRRGELEDDWRGEIEMELDWVQRRWSF